MGGASALPRVLYTKPHPSITPQVHPAPASQPALSIGPHQKSKTTLNSCKPLVLVVHQIGLEPTTY